MLYCCLKNHAQNKLYGLYEFVQQSLKSVPRIYLKNCAEAVDPFLKICAKISAVLLAFMPKICLETCVEDVVPLSRFSCFSSLEIMPNSCWIDYALGCVPINVVVRTCWKSPCCPPSTSHCLEIFSLLSLLFLSIAHETLNWSFLLLLSFYPKWPFG